MLGFGVPAAYLRSAEQGGKARRRSGVLAAGAARRRESGVDVAAGGKVRVGGGEGDGGKGDLGFFSGSIEVGWVAVADEGRERRGTRRRRRRMGWAVGLLG